ncbi:MAG: Hpt domain-containing protein [Bryobacteraceae bacterium]
MSIAEQLFHFDQAVALARVGGDEELLREVAALFLEESHHCVSSIREAAARRDPTALQYAAHNLKGAALNFGATSTCDAAFRLEMMGRTGDLAGVDATLNELESAVGNLRLLLAELL